MTVCAAEGTGVLSTQRSTCLMMVCRAALSVSLSSGREYIRSRWWAPSGTSTATTLSDTSSVTPKTDQGSSSPLLNTMLLVSLQQSSRAYMRTGQGTRFMHMTQRNTARHTSSGSRQNPHKSDVLNDMLTSVVLGHAAAYTDFTSWHRVPFGHRLNALDPTSWRWHSRLLPTSSPNLHAAPPSTTWTAPHPTCSCSAPQWSPSQRALGPKTCWMQMQESRGALALGTACTPARHSTAGGKGR
jgi:hypothetical protein